jgi:hypothetical protein
MTRDVVVLWSEGNWRCEIHTGRMPGAGSFIVYRGDDVVTAESVNTGAMAYARAEVLPAGSTRRSPRLGTCAQTSPSDLEQ